MRVKVNGQARQFDSPKTVKQILDELNVPQDAGIAVALNGTVVGRDRYATTYVEDGDALEIIHATAGG